MAELYEHFVALYPYPHERVRHGAPRAELNRRYLEHLYEGKNKGVTPIVVALDSTLLGTIENNVSVCTSTPVGEITAELFSSTRLSSSRPSTNTYEKLAWNGLRMRPFEASTRLPI